MKTWLRLGVIVAWCALSGWSVDWKALKPQGFVSDFAGVIDPSAKAQAEDYCARLQQATGVRIALVTVSSLQGEPIRDVSNSIARGWDVGRTGGTEGILLLLAIQERRHYLEIGSSLEPILPRGLSGGIVREMRPALRQQQYGEAILAAVETLGGAISKARKVSFDTRLRRELRPSFWGSFPWPLLVGGFILAIWLIRAGGPRGFGAFGGRGLLPWLFFGNVGGRSTWGGRGSGGFGGYDSGDACGGFGGGDFGGGRASSDW
ncbi:MAG TPA: TPM domain-containing protein [Bryobacteraceae bacterium]|jgi:uncharacterized protein